MVPRAVWGVLGAIVSGGSGKMVVCPIQCWHAEKPFIGKREIGVGDLFARKPPHQFAHQFSPQFVQNEHRVLAWLFSSSGLHHHHHVQSSSADRSPHLFLEVLSFFFFSEESTALPPTIISSADPQIRQLTSSAPAHTSVFRLPWHTSVADGRA